MSPAIRADLTGVVIGDGQPVAVMGVINVSAESFHRGSVYQDDEAMLRAALAMVEAGAALIDVGARSSAPYLDTDLDEAREAARLAHAVEVLAAKVSVPLSADTPRPGPARAALEAGARVINDVSTLTDPETARLVAAHGAGLLLMAAPAGGPPSAEPVPRVQALLAAGLERAARAGIPPERIVVDPGIGFFRAEALPWHEWDARVLAGLGALRALGRPVAVGVSRKSFIGAILDRPDPAERLSGSLAAAAVAVRNGAALVRTHDVAETRDAVRVAERLR
jgi:dihydropteroate synthase